MKLITVKEAKTIVEARDGKPISARAIQAQCASGDIKAEYIGGTYFIDRKSLPDIHIHKRGPKRKKKKPIF
jgi:hypothetical protein